jgi:hypothetical protein
MYIYINVFIFKTCSLERSSHLVINCERDVLKFPLALMGVLASGSAHALPSAQPPNCHQRKFFARRLCKVTLKHLLQPLPSEVISEVSEPYDNF